MWEYVNDLQAFNAKNNNSQRTLQPSFVCSSHGSKTKYKQHDDAQQKSSVQIKLMFSYKTSVVVLKLKQQNEKTGSSCTYEAFA